MVKHAFVPSFAKNKKMANFQFFDQNNGLTFSEKSHVFDCLNSLFFSLQKLAFLSRISLNIFSLTIFLRRKRWKIFNFLTKSMD